MEEESFQKIDNQTLGSRVEIFGVPFRGSGFVVGLLLIALILFGIITGYLSYQNDQLKQQVQKFESSKLVPSLYPTIFPTPTTEDDSNDPWKGYYCVIEDYSEIKNNTVSGNSRYGCGVSVTYCKDQICTPPVEMIECGQSKKICNVEIHCSCP